MTEPVRRLKYLGINCCVNGWTLSVDMGSREWWSVYRHDQQEEMLEEIRALVEMRWEEKET